MSKKTKEYIREEAKVIQRLQEEIDEIAIKEKGNKRTMQICGYLAIQIKLMTKTQEYLLAIMSRIDEIGDALSSISTIEAEPVKHGEWEAGTFYCRCTACGVEFVDETTYGPNCGAKMDEEEGLEKQEPAKKTKAKEEAK